MTACVLFVFVSASVHLRCPFCSILFLSSHFCWWFLLFSVSPEGRISANDLGMWSDKHIDGFKPLVDAIVAGGTVPGIQVGRARTPQRALPILPIL